MSLYFQSICSSSAGNCLTLWSESSRLVIDCGLSSMKRTRQSLVSLSEPSKIDAVLLTHIHTDHISYYPLRVLEELGLPIHLSQDCVDALREKHFNEYGFKQLALRTYGNKPFAIGDFQIHPFKVTHNPYYPTYGFEIRYQDTKIVIATDFNEWETIFERFINADFIFVESNHDLELLRQYYNPNSRYHLPNPRTANLLVNVSNESKRIPRIVMLGHLSDQRNTPRLAIQETKSAFENAGRKIPFELHAAPLRQAGTIITIR